MLEDMEKCRNTAIIVAAGSGNRLGSDIPKQFLKLNGREILSYSVKSFQNHPDVDALVIVTSAEYFEHVSASYPDCHVVIGGSTRQESVTNGMQAITDGTELVLVHDAARPLVSHDIISECLEKLMHFDGVAPAIKPTDSMIMINGEDFDPLERSSLRIVQTPQCFHADTLNKAHNSGVVDTDEMGLVRRAVPSARLGFAEGSPANMKVTRALDLEILQLVLNAGT